MSVKIRISYTEETELSEVIRLLSPVLKSWHRTGNQEGRYRKAYAEIEPRTNSGETPLKLERSKSEPRENGKRSTGEVRELPRKG